MIRMPFGKVLVSGAGIAGLTLAYWLKKHGFQPYLIDRAEGPGQAPDVVHIVGAGYRTAERMGLIGAIRGRSISFDGIEFLDKEHRSRGKTDLSYLRDRLDNRICTLLREDLEELLRERLEGEVPFRYSASIRALDQNPSNVDVSFEGGRRETYDLVVGADGIRSRVRRLAFGTDEKYERFCGFYSAAFSLRSSDIQDGFRCHLEPGRISGVLRSENRAMACFLYRAPWDSGWDALEDAEKRRLVRSRFAGTNCGCEPLLDEMDRSADFLSGPVSQIRMHAWTGNRVALVGDAAYCPSMLSGQGASLAMAGAYILAGELKVSSLEPGPAFAAYENALRAETARKHAATLPLPIRSATRFRTWLDVVLASWSGRPLLARAYAARRIGDDLSLPDY